ncbi:trimeric intracellular cation channel family protein [Endozoicomonas ascidiicola]|uniref:trimeric intracellular cation channel family protein n=1 Tax=Endozoicomonas ascidiicola TaxID=1698521 RepID=UPI000A961554|nr:trimeric intracellular cation channel family protein [Endozoicomonas ascidiicola]
MLETLYILAITVEAMAGAIVAGRKKMDPFGILIIACATAFAGGTLRDVVLDNHPMVWIGKPEYLLTTCSAALFVLFIRPWVRHLTETFLVLDAIGLITFSIIGAQKTLELGHGYLIASIMAVFTGAFGGVVRDILCNQLPLVFRKELYGSIAFFSAWLYFGLILTPLTTSTAILITLICGFLLRILAIYKALELPKFIFDDSDSDSDNNTPR